MKLHLPSPLRSALLACLTVVGSMSVSIGTGALATGVVAYAVVGSQAEGAALVNKTFVQDGVTYSGAELVTLDVSNAANVTAGGVSHTISGVANMTVTLNIDGTPSDKKFDEGVHVLNSSGKGDTNKDYAIWQDFCSTKAYYGQTLKLQGASAAWTLNLDFMPMSYGGLITDAASDAGSYRIGRTDGALNITANTAAGANMLINAETTLVSNGATVNTSGRWVLNKDLTFASVTTLAGGQEITLSGAGALNIGGSLTMNAGSRITGGQNELSINGSIVLDVDGLTAGAEALISTTGAVSAKGLTLFNYASLERGEYQLIRTTNEAANTMAALFSSNEHCVVFNKNGVVTLAVGDALIVEGITCSGNGGAWTSGRNTSDYDAVIFRDNHAKGSGSGGAIYNKDSCEFSGNQTVCFSGNTASYGGAIYNRGSFTLSDNRDVTFSGNTVSASSYAEVVGGAIFNDGTFTLSGNGAVTFCGNTASVASELGGGAIYNDYDGVFSLNHNDAVSFCNNNVADHAEGMGGAILNAGVLELNQNGAVAFEGNTAARGGAIFLGAGVIPPPFDPFNSHPYSPALFLCDNESVTFSGNTASATGSSAASGGAICIDYSGAFSLSGNGDVLFEKNAEVRNGSYRLRSIYSTGTLNLSASEGKSILFRDSVYAIGTVNLNTDGTGDIIFTGESTEADLREVKGGIDGTAQEIADSRSSVLDATVTLGGGTLQVRDAASLTVRNLTAADASELVLHEASFSTTGDSTLAAVTITGNSVLAAQEGASLMVKNLTAAKDAALVLDEASFTTTGDSTLAAVSISGNTSITAQQGATLMLTQAIANNGNLTLSGRLDISGLSYAEGVPGYINTEGESSTSGFASGDSRLIVVVEGSGTLNADSAVVLYMGNTLTLNSSGVAALSGADIVDYSTYYINGDSASLAAILGKSPTAAVQMAGGTLMVDTNCTTEIRHDNTSALKFTARQMGGQSFSGYGDLVFENRERYSYGDAIYNGGTFTLSENGDVTFSGNTASSNGGAIYNGGIFTLSGNGDVTFSGNTASYSGGAIFNNSFATFTLSDNGDVLFEKNAEVRNGTYRLRSIYSDGGTLNLSAAEGKSILFKDSVYARGTVNLNRDGTGDIIFTGESTKADLREVKGGVAGAAQEIADSRSSVLDATVTLGGGTLQVRDGASLTVRNLTAADGSELVLHDASFTTTDASTLEAVTISGNSVLAAQEGATLTLTQAITNNGVLALSGIINADAWEVEYLSTGDTHYINTADQRGNSGFLAFVSTAQMALTTGTGIVNADAAVVMHRGSTLTLHTNGIASGTVDNIDYSTYYLNGDSASLAAILGKSPTAAVQMSGGTLTVDTDCTTEIRHDNTSALEFTALQKDGKLFSDYKTIAFRNIERSSSVSLVYGGAIYNSKGTFTLSGNGDMSFFENTVFYSADDYYDVAGSSGGAIFNDSGATFTLSGNGNVTFSGNTASSSSSSPYHYDSSGGAIGNVGTFTLSGNREVTFSENTASTPSERSYGGAIYNSKGTPYHGEGTFSLSGNGNVTFSGNKVSSTSFYSYGGAIGNASGTFMLRENGDVTFRRNTSSSTSSSMGGAIGNEGIFTLSGNGEVTFSENTVSSSSPHDDYYACGGAIYNGAYYYKGMFTLSGNGSVTFSGNTASSTSSSYSYGGAIGNPYGPFTLSGNGDVTFSGNTASSSAAPSYGGAIYCGISGTFTLSGNGDVTFSGNTASSSSAPSYGGAIYNSCNHFTLSGNGNVLFEKNAEISNGTYRLRSIYSEGVLNLSASEGKKILFKDSIYAGSSFESSSLYGCKVKLNQNGTGDIIFTGESTESDLREVKGGIDGTAQEIADSRSSVLDATVTLDGGTLQVRDGASLMVRNLTAADGSELVLHDASFTTTGDSTLAAVSISGNASIAAQEGATLALQQTIINNGNLTLSGTINADALMVLDVDDRVYFNTEGEKAESGFLSDVMLRGIALAGGTGSVNTDAAQVVYHGQTVNVESDGFVTFSVSYDVDYRTYYLNDGQESLAAIITRSPDAAVQMANGTLNLADLGGGVSNAIHGSGLLVKNSSGTVELSGHNTYSGGTRLEAGTLVAGNVQALGTGAVALAGGTLDLGSYALNNELRVTGEAVLNKGNRYTGKLVLDGGALRGTMLQLNQEAELLSGSIANNMTGMGGVVKNGSGTAVLSGMNTYAGTTVVNEGTLQVSGLVTSNIELNGGTLDTDTGMTLAYGQSVTFNGGSVTGNLQTSDGSSLLVQTGTTISGNLTLNGGDITFINKGSDEVLDISGTLAVNPSQMKLVGYDSEGQYVLAHCSVLTGSLGNFDLTTSFPDGSRQQAVLTNASNYLILSVTGDATTLNWAGGSGTWAQGNGTKWTGATDTKFYNYDTVVIEKGGTVTISGEVMPKEMLVGGSTALTLRGTGSITGDATLSKTGSCTLTMNATNTYTGGTVIEEGTVKAGGAASFGENRVVLHGGELNLNAKAVANEVYATGGTISGGSAYAGTLTVEGAVALSGTLTAESVEMKSGSLTGGELTDTALYSHGGTLAASLTGESEWTVDGDVVLAGYAAPEWGTYITAGSLTVADGGELDCDVVLTGGTLVSDLHTVHEGRLLELSGGSVIGSIVVGQDGLFTMYAESGISGDLSLESGALFENNGNALTIGGTLSVAKDSSAVLSGVVKAGSVSLQQGATIELMEGNALLSVAVGAESSSFSGIELTETGMRGTEEMPAVLDNALLKLAEGTSFSLENLVLGAHTRITDDPAALELNNATVMLAAGVNVAPVSTETLEEAVLAQCGGQQMLTTPAGCTIMQLEASTFDSVTLTGNTLALQLSGIEQSELQSYTYVGISFINGGDYARFDSDLVVTLMVTDGRGHQTLTGWYRADEQSAGGISQVLFETAMMPEPATATLSLLALAALAARRRRR